MTNQAIPEAAAGAAARSVELRRQLEAAIEVAVSGQLTATEVATALMATGWTK